VYFKPFLFTEHTTSCPSEFNTNNNLERVQSAQLANSLLLATTCHLSYTFPTSLVAEKNPKAPGETEKRPAIAGRRA
jgi:hypothetical protein